MAPFGCHDWGIDNPDRGLFGRQLPAGNPVAALTVHWTVIHYRDGASLTPYTGEALVQCMSFKPQFIDIMTHCILHMVLLIKCSQDSSQLQLQILAPSGIM